MIDVNIILDRLIKYYNSNIPIKQIAQLASCLTASRVMPSDVAKRITNHVVWRKQVRKLSKIYQPPQRTEEWYNARNEMITASDCAQAIGQGKFGNQRDFFQKKVAPDTVPFNADVPPLVHGCKYEPVACSIYCARNNTKVIDFGLLRHPDIPFIGASPDGITEDGIMLEIKCPWRRVIDGTVPGQYYQQIQHQLDVCGLQECDYFEVAFVEYDDEKSFIDDIESDEKELVAANGNEKGLFIEYIQEGVRKYMYYEPEDMKDVQMALAWRDSRLNQVPSDAQMVCVTYWRVELIHIKRIYKDESFLKEKYSLLKDVWDKVLVYRRDADLFRTEVLEAKKTRRILASPSPPALPPICLCDDD